MVEKITLLFQLYPANKDFGSSVDAMVGTTENTKFTYNEPPSAPIVQFQSDKKGMFNKFQSEAMLFPASKVPNDNNSANKSSPAPPPGEI